MIVEIDDKYLIHNIYIFAGSSPVMRRYRKTGIWERKVGECNRCGKCCKAIREDHPLGSKEGCRYLSDQGSEMLCGLEIFRPFGCAIADPEGIETCTVKWEQK